MTAELERESWETCEKRLVENTREGSPLAKEKKFKKVNKEERDHAKEEDEQKNKKN